MDKLTAPRLKMLQSYYEEGSEVWQAFSMALSSLAPAGEGDVKRYDTLQENEPLGKVSPGDFRHRGVIEAEDGWLVTYSDYANLRFVKEGLEKFAQSLGAKADALQSKLAEAEGKLKSAEAQYKWREEQTFAYADERNEERARADKAEAENVEQARLLGMGAEREAALQARVAELEKVYAAAESLLKEAREDCVTELEFQAILKPGGKALQTAVIDARMQALTPSHPSAGRDEVREAAQELSDRVNDYAFTPREDGGIDKESAEYEVWCACLEANKKLRQALATPQGKEDAS